MKSVAMETYLAEVRKREQLEEELKYAKYRLGEHKIDEAVARVTAQRLGMQVAFVRFVMLIVRSHPRPIHVPPGDNELRVSACFVRKAITAAGGDPKLLRTISGVGYTASEDGLRWFKRWAPELFTDPDEVMRQYARRRTNGSHVRADRSAAA